MIGKFTIVVEDTGMDDGCTNDILQECSHHGKVLSARLTGTNDDGKEYDNDIMYALDYIDNDNTGPVPGKC